ncbi:hydroxyisourate hydrolase [Aureimonas flava]|uniref:5-hydroxyisourate hydrolase n=1 Tax=Aureimonas flava TaxID=2320271 RepID=A0A3A1WJJ8_9HYPH|nr:hydroxyisourate hydrolase [Aureimonas flava]RIY00122.1 hydroxyisourate hydrolase [Aureimonas flava]
MADTQPGSGRLTTHVLDTARGVPARDLELVLHRLEGDRRELAGEGRTNHDGRCDAPLLDGAAFRHGTYEITFFCGPYFDAQGVAPAQPKFLDDVVIRFGISEDRHYHVPLLLSPFGYSTYRGS